MNFEEWWNKTNNELGYNADRTSSYTFAMNAWNAAIEQAAQVAEDYKIHPHESTMAGVNIAEMVRRMK